MVAGELGTRLASVQVRVAAVQVHPVGPDSVVAVVFGGSVSVRVTPVAALGPALLTICVNVRVLPAAIGTVPALLVTDRSAEAPTYVVTLALLLPEFGSDVEDETPAVSVSAVPAVTVEFTVTINVKLAEDVAPVAAMLAESVH